MYSYKLVQMEGKEVESISQNKKRNAAKGRVEIEEKREEYIRIEVDIKKMGKGGRNNKSDILIRPVP